MTADAHSGHPSYARGTVKRTYLSALTLLALAGTLLVACGPSIPPRFVLERDLDHYAYRRYQKMLDIEFPVNGNPAEAHTATYVLRHGEDIILTTAFVTIYERAASLAAELEDRLDSLGTYDVTVDRVEGEWVWSLDGGGDRWLLWVSGNRIVKLGAPPGRQVPEELADAYLDLYPSDLDEHGRAREGTASVGESSRQTEENANLEMPDHLREGSPQ